MLFSSLEGLDSPLKLLISSSSSPRALSTLSILTVPAFPGDDASLSSLLPEKGLGGVETGEDFFAGDFCLSGLG